MSGNWGRMHEKKAAHPTLKYTSLASGSIIRKLSNCAERNLREYGAHLE
jgi:hypothetical protein